MACCLSPNCCVRTSTDDIAIPKHQSSVHSPGAPATTMSTTPAPPSQPAVQSNACTGEHRPSQAQRGCCDETLCGCRWHTRGITTTSPEDSDSSLDIDLDDPNLLQALEECVQRGGGGVGASRQGGVRESPLSPVNSMANRLGSVDFIGLFFKNLDTRAEASNEITANTVRPDFNTSVSRIPLATVQAPIMRSPLRRSDSITTCLRQTETPVDEDVTSDLCFSIQSEVSNSLPSCYQTGTNNSVPVAPANSPNNTSCTSAYSRPPSSRYDISSPTTGAVIRRYQPRAMMARHRRRGQQPPWRRTRSRLADATPICSLTSSSDDQRPIRKTTNILGPTALYDDSLGARPPCLGQECSPVSRGNPCVGQDFTPDRATSRRGRRSSLMQHWVSPSRRNVLITSPHSSRGFGSLTAPDGSQRGDSSTLLATPGRVGDETLTAAMASSRPCGHTSCVGGYRTVVLRSSGGQRCRYMLHLHSSPEDQLQESGTRRHNFDRKRRSVHTVASPDKRHRVMSLKNHLGITSVGKNYNAERWNICDEDMLEIDPTGIHPPKLVIENSARKVQLWLSHLQPERTDMTTRDAVSKGGGAVWTAKHVPGAVVSNCTADLRSELVPSRNDIPRTFLSRPRRAATECSLSSDMYTDEGSSIYGIHVHKSTRQPTDGRRMMMTRHDYDDRTDAVSSTGFLADRSETTGTKSSLPTTNGAPSSDYDYRQMTVPPPSECSQVGNAVENNNIIEKARQGFVSQNDIVNFGPAATYKVSHLAPPNPPDVLFHTETFRYDECDAELGSSMNHVMSSESRDVMCQRTPRGTVIQRRRSVRHHHNHHRRQTSTATIDSDATAFMRRPLAGVVHPPVTRKKAVGLAARRRLMLLRGLKAVSKRLKQRKGPQDVLKTLAVL